MTGIRSVLLGAFIVGVSVGAQGEEQSPTSRFYSALSAGQSRVDIDDIDLASLGATGFESKDQTDTAWKLALGYQFNRYLAIEGGYVDYGRFSQSATITAPVSGSFNGNIEAKGWFIDAVGSYPLGASFSVLGRLGTVRSTTTTHLSTAGAFAGALAAAGIDSSTKESEWNWHYGLGVQYDFARSVGLRLEYDRTRNVGNSDTTGEGDIDVWSLGVLVRF